MKNKSEIKSWDESGVAAIGGGCFWCTEAVFSQLKGVFKVESGYAGGTVDSPTYEQVCSGRTGHAEVIQISFNPKIISYKELLEVFFVIHDPTTLNRQGNDVGTQYRSVIYYHDEAQKQTAKQLITKLETSNVYGKPIVTQLEPFATFYKAEDHHQDFFKRNPTQAYCKAVIPPKLAKLRRNFENQLKESAD